MALCDPTVFWTAKAENLLEVVSVWGSTQLTWHRSHSNGHARCQWHTSCCAGLCQSEQLSSMDVFRQVGHRTSILKEELVNSYKNFHCKIVFHSLLNVTHITQWFLFVPNPNVGSLVEHQSWAADLAHPNIFVWRHLWVRSSATQRKNMWANAQRDGRPPEYRWRQGCGLGLDVSVSRRSQDISTSRLGLVLTKIVNVSVSSRSRPLTSRAQDQFSAKFWRSQ